MMYASHITLSTLNLYSAVCQLYLNTTGKKKKNPNPNPGLESESLHHKVNILGNSYSSLARFSKQNKRQTPRKRTENPNPWLNLNFRQTRFFRNKYIPRNLGNISVLRNSSIWSEIHIKLSIFLLPGTPIEHIEVWELDLRGIRKRPEPA